MDLLPFVHNALGIEQEGDGFSRLVRFTKQQRMSLGTHALYRAMGKTSSGCSLRFRTRGSSLSFRAKRFNQSLLHKSGDLAYDFPKLYGGNLQMRDFFDLVIDGNLVESIPLRTGFIETSWLNKEGLMQDVQLFFPLGHQVGVKDLACNAAMVEVARSHTSMLVLGDSIVQGVGAETPSQALTPRLASLTGFEVINQGLMGSLFNPEVVEPLGDGRRVSKVIVGYGTNDWILRPTLVELETVVEDLLQRLFQLYPTAGILLLSPLWRGDWELARPMGSFSEMSAAIERVARLFPLVTYIDCRTCIEHSKRVFADGHLHPNKEGFALFAHALEPYLL